MAVTGRDIYSLICFDTWQDTGLTMGIFTDAQFLEFLNQAIAEFLKENCPEVLINTQTVMGGQSQYAVPDLMQRVDLAFLGGVYLEPSTAADLFTGARDWRTEQDTPARWHSDELTPDTVELAPLPVTNSLFVPGPNEPDLPHSQDGGFSITDASNVVQPPDVHGALALVGPVGFQPLATLDDPIPVMAADFALAYLGFGVLKRIYSGDNELKDNARAEWAAQEFQEGMMILKGISNEAMAES